MHTKIGIDMYIDYRIDSFINHPQNLFAGCFIEMGKLSKNWKSSPPNHSHIPFEILRTSARVVRLLRLLGWGLGGLERPWCLNLSLDQWPNPKR